MKFLPTQFEGAWLVESVRHEDERGYFARTWCQQEFAEQGLKSRLVQTSVSFNRRKGTLRGMHFQAPPHEEAKLVRCTRGSIYDVIVDLRLDSATFRQWQAFDLTASNQHALYVPEGFAHGFLTLEDDSEIQYQMSAFYHPESVRGFRWNDPGIGIDWQHPVQLISERDANQPLLSELESVTA